MDWFVRYSLKWERATEKQKAAVTRYLETGDENQVMDEPVQFKDFRYKQDTIYVVYMCKSMVEMLLDTPEHVAYINRITS